MGVRITTQYIEKVALYDSVSGFAFGPTFASEDEAEAFLAFARDHEKRDLRVLNDNELEALYSAWLNQDEINEGHPGDPMEYGSS